jgi:very-short-patch-repair endonuclease
VRPRYIPYRPRLTRQKPLGSYIADFYCAQQLLVIELDGDSHYADGAAIYDNARTVALNARGIRVVRFTNSDVMKRFEGVCSAILAELGKG